MHLNISISSAIAFGKKSKTLRHILRDSRGFSQAIIDIGSCCLTIVHSWVIRNLSPKHTCIFE